MPTEDQARIVHLPAGAGGRENRGTGRIFSGDLGVRAEVECFHFAGSGRNGLEGGFELAEVVHLDHDVKLGEMRRSEAELASGEPVAGDQAVVSQVPKVAVDTGAELKIANAFLEVTPNMIDVHESAHVDRPVRRPQGKSKMGRRRYRSRCGPSSTWSRFLFGCGRFGRPAFISALRPLGEPTPGKQG